MTTLTRRYPFSASHRLHTGELSESENTRIYGKCNNPFGHGHNYELSVTLAGEANVETGLLVERAALDAFVEETVLRRVRHRNLNEEIAEFRRCVPTTENLTAVVAAWLHSGWPFACRLERVHLQETGRNSFEMLLAASDGEVAGGSAAYRQTHSVQTGGKRAIP